jgi:hypothetical protein
MRTPCSGGSSTNPTSSRSCFRRDTLSLVFVATCCIAVYSYLWRGSLTIFLAPPSSSFKYRDLDRDRDAPSYAVVYNATTAATNTRHSSTQEARQRLTQPLPEWFANYVHWHARVRASGLNASSPILLVSIGGHHVGGLADRLRSLPFLLWEAVRTNRVFLMQWTNPCPLEEFLVPPLGGIDWTVPPGLDRKGAVWYDYDEQKNVPLDPVVLVRHNRWTFLQGMRLLAKELNVTTLSDPAFAHMFEVLLTPSRAVQQSLDETMERLKLTPQHYDAIHLRARYPGTSDAFQPKSSLFSRTIDADGFQWTTKAQTEVLRLATRARDCLVSQQNTASSSSSWNNNASTIPIYFASDTNEAVKLVTRTTSLENKHTAMVGLVTSGERLHLDRNDRTGLIFKTAPVAFHPVFVDLWILSQARCLVVGAGGYGTFASILGVSDCPIVYYQKNKFGGANSRYCPGGVE